MALLSEYAITPDVFDTTYYPHEEVGTARLEILKNVLLEESVLRNLRAGEWLQFFRNQDRSWHRRGLELLKKMVTQNRIRNAEAVLDDIPLSDAMWCREAITSHHMEPLTGVISTAQIVNEVGENPILGRIDRLDSSPCWTCREPSTGVVRCLSEYKDQLRLIMKSSNSILFIDPHLDPSQTRYKDVLPLLLFILYPINWTAE